jgi:cell division protease FtsH
MVNQLSMYSHAKLDYSQLQRDSAGEDTMRQVEVKSDELYSRTLQAITSYAELMEAIKTTLLERYVLSKDEVFALLDELMATRTKAPLVAELKPTFH